MQTFEIKKFKTLTGHNGSVYAIAGGINPDTFYSSGDDGMIVEWKLDGAEDGKMLAKVSNSVYAMAIIKETGQLVVGHNYEGIHFIDIMEGKEQGSVKLTEAAIFDIKYHNNNIFVATGTGEIIIVELNPTKIIHRIKLSSMSVRSLEIMGNVLLAGYSDNTIRLFDLHDFRPKKVWKAHKNSVFTLKGNPSGKYLLSGSRDAHLKIWEAGNDFILLESIVAHMFTINSIVFNPSGTHFMTASMDKTLKLWDAHEWKLLKVIDKERFDGHSSSVNKLVWSNYKNRVISCSDDRTISLWDIKTY